MHTGKVRGLRRVADRNGLFKLIAVDRNQPIKSNLDTDLASLQNVPVFKKKLIEILRTESSAMLLDPYDAYKAGISVYGATNGLIFTLEDSVFIEKNGERFSSAMDGWNVNKIKRIGGDAVKILVWYRPDVRSETRKKQQEFVKRIGEVCNKFDIPFLLELQVYPFPGDANSKQLQDDFENRKSDYVLGSVSAFADSDFHVDLFILESPISPKLLTPNEDSERKNVQNLFNEMGKIANRPWVMLSAGATKDEFFKILTHAYDAGASGYLADSAIWNDALQNFCDWAKIEDHVKNQIVPYIKKLNELTDAMATPWHECKAVVTREKVKTLAPKLRINDLKRNVSAPSATVAIQKLEKDLGVSLLVRKHTRGVTLSPAGNKFLQKARKNLNDVDKLNDIAKGIETAVHSHLKVGCLDCLADIIFPSLRRSYAAEFPHVKIHQEISDHDEMVKLLYGSKLDLALTLDFNNTTDLKFVPLTELPPFAIVDESHPLASQSEVSIDQLKQHSMVLLDKPHFSDYYLSLLDQSRNSVNVTEKVNNSGLLRSMVANGFGYSIVNVRPPYDHSPDGKPLKYLPIDGEVKSLKLGVLLPNSRISSKLTDWFIKHFRPKN